MITIEFVWWQLLLGIIGAMWLAGSVSFLFSAGWRMALLWPVYMLMALLGWVNVQ